MRILAGLWCVVMLSIGVANAGTITLEADGSGDYATIQEAINHAAANDVIVLEPGTYQGTGNRDISMGSVVVTIRSVDPEDPDVVAGTVIDCQGSAAENHRGFLFQTDLGESWHQTLSGVTIMNGYVSGSGGGILCNNDSQPIIEKNIVKNNTSEWSGGGICCWAASPTIVGNTITGNQAPGAGGIHVRAAPCLILENVISNNTATTDKGGGIYVDGCFAFIGRNTISDNEAQNGGGIFCLAQPSAVIENNIVRGNHVAITGGAIYMEGSSPTIANNIISENEAGSSGAGISCNNSAGAFVNNTIVWNGSVGAGIHCGFGSMPDIANNIVAFNDRGIEKGFGDPAPLIENNCVYGNTAYDYAGGLVPGPGDISQDPILANYAQGYLHIQPGSPCVDKGDSSIVQLEWRDIDDQDRIQGADVDMGADESDGTRWPILHTMKADGSGDYAKIQDAIDAALDEDVIELQIGSYTGNRNYDLDYGGKAITIRSTNPDDPNTVRDTAVDCTGSWNHRGFVFHNNEGPDSIISGITIKADMPQFGDFIVNGITERHGGGILCYGASPTITKCVIEGCVTSYYGGGICLSKPDGGTQGANATVIDCTISSNGSGWAPGVYVYASYPTFTNCCITENRSGMHHIGGVGIHDCSDETVTFTNCEITRNYATNGDGGMSIANSDVIIENCVISQNSAQHGAGGIAITSASVVGMKNCLITGNLMRGSFHGAAVAAYNSDVTITNCSIEGNWSPWESAAAVWLENSNPATVKNTIVWNNEPAVSPLAIHLGVGSVDYSNVQGGFVGTDNLDENPLFAVNGLWVDTLGTPNDRNDDAWQCGDYHLRSEGGRWAPTANSGDGAWIVDTQHSPSIDAGDPGDPVGAETSPHGSCVNMGYYGGTAEASRSTCPADLTGDSKVNMLDLAVLARYWLWGTDE